MLSENRHEGFLRGITKRLLGFSGAAALTLTFFLILPVLQAIAADDSADTLVRAVDTASFEPPPPPEMEEPEPEDEPEEEPPKLEQEVQPLDLSQLELALNPGFGDGFLEGDFGLSLEGLGGQQEDVDALFSLSDLDQVPRAVFQPSPTLSEALRKKRPATVYVLFAVDQKGRVVDPIIQSSSDPAFERPALQAVKQWRFEPGKRNGKPVRFRVRQPLTFSD